VNLTLIIRTWRNRYQGADLHSVEIVRDGHHVARLKPLLTEPLQLAADWLEINNLIPKRNVDWFEHWIALKPPPYVTRCNVANKSDL
jgi:hypothetical protein